MANNYQKKGDFAKHQMKNKPLSRVPGIGRTKAKLLATFEIKEVRKTGKTTDKLIAKFNIKKLASGHVDCIYEINLLPGNAKRSFNFHLWFCIIHFCHFLCKTMRLNLLLTCKDTNVSILYAVSYQRVFTV